MLKALASKHFVRVQDERGQTSHFTLTTYRQLSNPPVQADPNDPSSALDRKSTRLNSSHT